VPTWPAIIKIEFLQPAGVKWSYFMRNRDPGPNAYQKPENRGGLERTNDVVFSNDGKTMYVVDYGEVFTDFTKPTPFYTTLFRSDLGGSFSIVSANAPAASPKARPNILSLDMAELLARTLRGGFHNHRWLRSDGVVPDADAHVWRARHGREPWTSGSCA